MLSRRCPVVISSRFRRSKGGEDLWHQRIAGLAGPGILGRGSSSVEALVTRLVAATSSRSARAFLASWRSLCARISRWDSSALRLLRSIRISSLSTSSINFAAFAGFGSPEDATAGRLAVAVPRRSRSWVPFERAAGVGSGASAIATPAPGAPPDDGIGLASRLTVPLWGPAPEDSFSACEAALAAARACFDACRAFCDASAAVPDACDAFSTARWTSLADLWCARRCPAVDAGVGDGGATISDGVAAEDEPNICPTLEGMPAHPKNKTVDAESRKNSGHEAGRSADLRSAEDRRFGECISGNRKSDGAYCTLSELRV